MANIHLRQVYETMFYMLILILGNFSKAYSCALEGNTTIHLLERNSIRHTNLDSLVLPIISRSFSEPLGHSSHNFVKFIFKHSRLDFKDLIPCYTNFGIQNKPIWSSFQNAFGTLKQNCNMLNILYTINQTTHYSDI